jgi:hypothetical protein
MVLPSPPLRASAAPPSQRRLGPLQRAGLTGRLAAGRDGGTTPPPGSFHGLTRRRSQKRKGALRCQLFRGVPCGARSLPARGGGGGGGGHRGTTALFPERSIRGKAAAAAASRQEKDGTSDAERAGGRRLVCTARYATARCRIGPEASEHGWSNRGRI